MVSLTTLAGAFESPLFLANALAVVVSVGILGYTLRHRDFPGAAPFVLWLLATALWTALHTVTLLVSDPGLRVVVDSLSLAALPLGATGWLLFILAYSGRWNWHPSRSAVLLGGSSIVAALFLATNPLHGLVYTDPVIETVYGVSALTEFTKQPGFGIVIVYVYGLYLAGIAVLLELAFSTDRFYRDQTIALLVAVTVPLTVGTLVITRNPVLPADLTPVSFGVASLPLAYAVFRSKLLRLVPASFRLGERKAIETLDQGVLVLDPQDRVVFANTSLADVAGTTTSALVGEHVDDALEASPLEPAPDWAVDSQSSRRPDGGAETLTSESGIPRTLQHPTTGLTYEVIESHIDDPEGPELGRTLFFRDVTEERRRKQRLLVLNRVVRHNLRNDMNVLRGHVRLLEGEADEESVAVIEDIASDLIRLGEKAHEMDRIIQEASQEASPVNVTGIVDRVVDRHVDADASVEVRGPAQAWVESHGPVVEAITSNLIENAVRHSAPEQSSGAGSGAADDGDGASDVGAAVVVDVTVSDRAVTLTVSDNGPGIPEQEIATLMSGEVSALQHGSGIGLWMVKWCVDVTNADWEIDTDDGTRVTVTFARESDQPIEQFESTSS